MGGEQQRGGQDRRRPVRRRGRPAPTTRRPAPGTPCPASTRAWPRSRATSRAGAPRTSRRARAAGPAQSTASTGATEQDQPQGQPAAGLAGQHGHRATTRGAPARRASRRSTSSRVPGPRQGITGQPSAASPASTWSRSSRRIRQAISAMQRVHAVGHPRTRVRGQGVDDHHGQPALHEAGGGGDDRGAEHRREHEDHAAAGHAQLEPGRDPLGQLPGADAGEQVEQGPQVPGAGAVAEQPAVTADHPQPDPVTGPDVVLGQRRGRADALVEAARRAVDARRSCRGRRGRRRPAGRRCPPRPARW